MHIDPAGTPWHGCRMVPLRRCAHHLDPPVRTMIDQLAPHPVLLIVVIAVAAHLVVRGVRAGAERILAGERGTAAALRLKPKAASLLTIIVSALTFTIYFLAIGLILSELGLSLTAYLTSASVIGLAVGFGSQGLVQDVVTGLTLIFSGVLDVGDVVDVAGHTGRVESVGLRFTVLVNLLDQRVYVPNRNIVHISRYRNGYIRAYVDLQVPAGADEKRVAEIIDRVSRGVQRQHGRVILRPPELLPIRTADPAGWRYLRVKFRLWPGQGALLETAFRQRALASMREIDEKYADWMIAITYRAE